MEGPLPRWPLWASLTLNGVFIAYHAWQLWQGAHAWHQWGILLHCLAAGGLWVLNRWASR